VNREGQELKAAAYAVPHRHVLITTAANTAARRCKAKTVKAIVDDMLAAENHIVAHGHLRRYRPTIQGTLFSRAMDSRQVG